MRPRFWGSASWTACLALAVVGLISGCGAGGGIQPGEHVTVYVSAPLRGPDAARGRAAVRGIRRALAPQGGSVGELRVRAVYMDDAGAGAWSPVRVAANARRATEDSTAVAYIGELNPRATRISRAITDQAGMLQVAPVGERAMREVLAAIRDAGGSGDDRQAVREAWQPIRG